MSSAHFPERFCQAITEISERGSLSPRPENRLQVDLPGDLTNLWADDRQIVALNKALDSPAPILVVSMKL